MNIDPIIVIGWGIAVGIWLGVLWLIYLGLWEMLDCIRRLWERRPRFRNTSYPERKAEDMVRCVCGDLYHRLYDVHTCPWTQELNPKRHDRCLNPWEGYIRKESFSYEGGDCPDPDCGPDPRKHSDEEYNATKIISHAEWVRSQQEREKRDWVNPQAWPSSPPMTPASPDQPLPYRYDPSGEDLVIKPEDKR